MKHLVMQQTHLPKPQETQRFEDGFDLEIFLSDNWHYILIFLVILALVIIDYKRKQKARQKAKEEKGKN
ncbi:hypothetical protein [Psychroflexus halocasei]|uniref:Uncharacterized protein n=1 Tax=Psychroflexus halocasei TaxID=908615 RepID=A0A1H3VDJ0_9FLAO|nr:hypothetical protein [Psychroflexus halocasei]SDZ72866.1 hypothetical protein SAMN05421540_10122 [Psychroflexus halocasei]